MFKKVRIQNFRQFKDLTLDNLAQINLITGANNTGKTTLLETLFLLANPTNPDKILTIAQLRGNSHITQGGQYGWGFIFHDGSEDQPIVLESRGEDESRRTLEVGISEDLGLVEVDNQSKENHEPFQSISTTLVTAPILQYGYKLADGNRIRQGSARILATDQGPIVQRSSGLMQDANYFLANGKSDTEADAERFSRLVAARRKSEVIEMLRTVEPRLTDLIVLAQPSSTVAADLGSGPLVPLNYMGRGLERLLTLILAILGSAGGMVLIDEIEDGLHYSVLPLVWKAVTEAALRSSVQVFATTHSYECIQAAIDASAESPGKLAMLRLARKDGRIHVVDVDDEGLRDAVSLGFEMR